MLNMPDHILPHYNRVARKQASGEGLTARGQSAFAGFSYGGQGSFILRSLVLRSVLRRVAATENGRGQVKATEQ